MSPLAIHLMNQRISVVEPHQNGVIGKDSAFQGVQQTLQVLDVVDEKNFAKKRLLCTVCIHGKYESSISILLSINQVYFSLTLLVFLHLLDYKNKLRERVSETLWNIKLLFYLLTYLFITVHGIENKIQKSKKP